MKNQLKSTIKVLTQVMAMKNPNKEVLKRTYEAMEVCDKGSLMSLKCFTSLVTTMSYDYIMISLMFAYVLNCLDDNDLKWIEKNAMESQVKKE